MSARCNCYKGHNSNSGRCNARDVEGDYCEDCLTHCITKESLERIVKETTAKDTRKSIEIARLREALEYVNYAAPVEFLELDDHETIEVTMTVKAIKDIRAALDAQ